MTIYAALPLSSAIKNTLVVLLGTSRASRGTTNASLRGAPYNFSLSARRLQAYFLDVYKLDEKHLLNLFDAGNPLTVEQEINHFLRVQSKRDTIQCIVLYYAGYYVEYSADLALQLQYAQEGMDTSPQALRLATLARILNYNLGTAVERVIIFDGYLVQSNANMLQLAGKAIERAFALPPDDEPAPSEARVVTSVLYACQPASVLIELTKQSSPFSEALLAALEHGTTLYEDTYLSMRTVHSLMHTLLAHDPSQHQVQPLLLASVQQKAGRSSIDLPLFPNLRKPLDEQRSVLKHVMHEIFTVSQRLRYNRSVREATVRYLTAANIDALKELVAIPIQNAEPPKALFVQRGKLYLSTPKFRSIDLDTGASIIYSDRPYTLDPLALVHDDFLYLRIDERTLGCFAIDSNQQRWSTSGHGATRLQDAPLVVQRIVYLLFAAASEQQEHHVRAVDAITGRTVWEIVFQQGTPHSPMMAATHLFMRMSDNRIYAIDTAHFQSNWSFGSPDGSITFDPVVSQGLVYLVVDRYGQRGSILYALDLATGKLCWSNEIDADPLSIEYAPLVQKDLVYIVSRRKKQVFQLHEHEKKHYALHAFHAVTGEKRWDYPVNESNREERILSQPLMIDDRLCLLLWDSVQRVCVVHCLNAITAQMYQRIPLLTQRTLFAQPQKGSLRFSPLVSGSLLAIPCTLSAEPGHDKPRSCVFVLDMQTLTLRQEILLQGVMPIAPLFAHGLLYLLAQDAESGERTRLLVIDPATGRLCWEYAQADVIACAPVVSRATLCFVTAASDAYSAARYLIRIFHLDSQERD